MKNSGLSYTDKGKGPVLLLIHGFPLCKKMWSDQVDFFAAKGYRVIAPDLRGFGESPCNNDFSFDMNSLADDVVDLMDCLSVDKAVVGGMSMGGYILLNLMDRHFSRLDAAIFIVTRSEGDDEKGRQRRTELAGYVDSGDVSLVHDAFESVLFGPTVKNDKAYIVPQVRRWMEAADKRALAGALRGMRDRHDYKNELGRFELPTLVIGAELDICISPDSSASIAKGLPDAILHIIKDVGHMANMEAPEDFNAIVLDFLKRVHV